jgi:tetratricopeptide (TPR) repeat protein
MPKPSIETFKEAVDAYENSLNRSNVHEIETQLSKPIADLLENAKRESYLAIVEMCGYLNSWRGAADTRFLKNVQDVLRDLQGLIERNADLMPFAYLVAYAQGFVLRGQGRHKEALEAFERSAEFNKDFFRADAQKAAQHIYLDDLPEAMRLIELAIKKTPPTSPAFANEKWTAARIKFFLGDYKAAIDLLDESIELNDDLWYTVAYQCSAYAHIAERLLVVLENKFGIKTLQDVIDREKLNPTAGSKSVDAGRQHLHDGLIRAGLLMSRY